jgi:hypothetical protein
MDVPEIANVSVLLITTFFLIIFITPRIPAYKINAEDQKYISIGKNFEALWPKLPEKTKHEINSAYVRK